MPLSFNLSFTDTAQAAIFNFTKTGVVLNFTHIQIGSGNKAPTGTETALLQPKLASPIAGGSQPSPTQIRMAAVFSGSTSFNISEVGMWAGDPAVAGSKLLAYWSQASGFIAVKSPGVDFVFSYDMVLNTAAPLGAINIIADPSISAIIAAITAHEAKNDPHPQYTTPDEVVALVEARVHDSVLDVGAVNAAKVALNPPIGAYGVTTEFTYKSASTNTGAMTLDAGAGPKSLIREDGQPMQAGDVAANVMVPVLFDVSAQAFRVLDKVNSQINDRIDAKVVTHKADPDPHPQYTTDAEVRALIEARVGDYVIATGTAAAYVAVLNPPVTAYDANTAFAFKVPATNTGAVTLDAGGGAKPLVREDGAAMLAGDTPAGAVLTVVYDVSTTSFRSTEMVNSQANALIDAKMVAHRAEVDPHSQYATDTDLATGLATRLPLTGGKLSGDLTLDGLPDGSSIRRLYLSESGGDTYGGLLGYDSVLDQLFLATRNSSTADVKALTIARGGTGINVPGVLTQAGSQVLSIANFNGYTPTLTGAGASGNWNITSALSILQASQDGDRTLATRLPTTTPRAVRYDFANGGSAGVGSRYAGVMTYSPWTGDTASTGDASYQMGFGGTVSDAGGMPMLTIRQGIDATWKPWYTLLHSGNVSSYGVARSEFRSFGTVTINPNGVDATCTTAQFIAHLTSLGFFNYSSASAKCSWSYSSNNDLTDTGFGTVDLAGCVIETWVDSANKHVRLTRPTAGAGGFQVLVYNDQGANYAPGWRAFITSENLGSSNAGTATALKTARSINSTAFDGTADIQTTEWFHSQRDFATGTLIQTSIDYSVAAGDPFVLEIKGNSYGAVIPYDIQCQGYIYNSTIINYGGYSNGKTITGLVAINYGGKLCFWWPRQDYWQGYNVRVYTAFGPRAVNKVVSITDVAKPTTDKQVSFDGTIRQSLHEGNWNGYAPSLSGGGASGTWNIGINGNANTATYLNSGQSATDVANITGRINSGFYQCSGPTVANGWPYTGSWMHLWANTHSNGANYFSSQFAADFYSNNIYYRSTSGDGARAWVKMITDANYSQYAVARTSANRPGVTKLYRNDGDDAYNLQTTWGADRSGYWSLRGFVSDTYHAGVFVSYAGNSDTLGTVHYNRTMQKRRTRINPSDGTSLNSSIGAPEMGFTYGGSGEPVGPYIAFGGLGGDIDYSCQLVGAYGGGNDYKIRTRNDDAGVWNPWRTIITDGNFNNFLPAGARMLWHSSAAPTGFLICDGSAVSRSAYGALFAAIGVMFGGGDGSSTFNLPDHRNRTHMGAGGSYGSGAVGGTADAIVPAHDHYVSISGGTSYGGAHTHTYRTHRRDATPTGVGYAGNASTNYDWYNWQTGANPGDAEGNHSHSVSVAGQTNQAGQSATGANLPPFIASYVIIKY